MKGKRVKLPSKYECFYRKMIEKESIASREGFYLKSEKFIPPVTLLRTIMAKDDSLILFEAMYLCDGIFDKMALLSPDDLETWVPEVMKEFKQWLEGERG